MSRSPRLAVPAPPSRRAARREFADLVRKAPQAALELPLTHVTDGYSFRDIMAAAALQPTPCHVFGGQLVYLFYGRPAYRAAAQAEANGSEAYWPVCFVLESDAVAATRIYPFDSGAFHYRRFDDFMYHRMIKEDFELDSAPESPGKLVHLFWRDMRSYFNASAYGSFEPGPLDFEASAYRRLIRHEGRAGFDERNSAIEIQTDQPVDLPGNTIAVILPYEFATPEMLAKIDKLGAIALPFDVVRRQGPTEMVGQIYTLVRDLLGGTHAPGRCKCW